LETLKVFEATFLTREEHERRLETLQAAMRAIQQDEQDNTAIRNSLQPIIRRRGSDCAEEFRAALARCNKSLQLIETRKRTVEDYISHRKALFDQELQEYDTTIREIGEQIEAWAPELAQHERTKRAIHIMKTLVEMRESGMACWSDCELDELEEWIGCLAARKRQ
jgi:chromosome segregation ATPase